MDLFGGLIVLVILVYSAILHEIAHGLVAYRLGDPTAKLSGRLTLNPIPHIDPFMSILLPLLLIISGSPVVFGAAKPVPVDPFNLRDGRKDLALVSIAGPLTNVMIAVTAVALFRILHSSISPVISGIILQIVQLNLLLAIFNLLPIPPLDGSKVLAQFLPEDTARSYLSLGTFGFMIIFLLLAFPIGGFSLNHLIITLLAFALHLLGL